MKIGPQQIQKLSHQLVMTPQLQQAIKLLQLSRYELVKLIEQTLVENPTLDSDSTTLDSDETGDTKDIDNNDYEQPTTDDWKQDEIAQETTEAEWQDYIQSGSGVIREKQQSESGSSQPNTSNQLYSKQSLQEYLQWQINVSSISSELKEIGLFLMGAINDDGYLIFSVKELLADQELQTIIKQFIKNNELDDMPPHENYNFDLKYHDHQRYQQDKAANKKLPAKSASNELSGIDNKHEKLYWGLEQAILKLQDLDPPGVFSRSLQECLEIQLKNQQPLDELAVKIVHENFALLIKQDLLKIAKLQKVTLEEVMRVKFIVTTLEPQPGRNFNTDPISYITPDVFVFKTDTGYVVRINNDNLPNLRINKHYQNISEEMNKSYGKQKNRSDNMNVLTNQYLVEKIRAAEWLIRSIEQRQKTILRVSESIVNRQQEFFEKGVEALKPMVLKDIAQDIGVHESTVSRITSNKFMHSPQGIHELKFFFSSGIKQDDGDFISSEKIKDIIQKMVANENPKKPLTDSALAEKLEQEMTIKVARRTVAKYREALNIEPSNQRKKMFN